MTQPIVGLIQGLGIESNNDQYASNEIYIFLLKFLVKKHNLFLEE